MINNEDLNYVPYEKSTNLSVPKGANSALINAGTAYGSLVNKLHLIKLGNNLPAMESGYVKNELFTPKTFADLCKMDSSAVQYDPEDFLYCKNLGFPINHLITLRRFPFPCTDNIYTRKNQAEPDIARMVTYFSQDVNKIEELLGFSYAMKWKELTAEMEQASAIGDQSGFTGFMKKTMAIVDPTLAGNALQGENQLNYDPKHDQNRAYGPVDSITQTHIRDTGLEFSKEFEIVFEYEMRSINGRSADFAMKDIIANVLATTHNNGKFWPGSRYWVGERPSRFLDKFKFMSPDSIETFFNGAHAQLKSALSAFSNKGTAIEALKQIMTNGIGLALGKLLDTVGRPSVLVMNSLLSGEPTGFWHLTIGNPDNPQMCIGNLIITGTDISFPTDTLSYGDFPTKMQVKVKLKPGQPKDKAGIETMLNMGKQRIYYNPQAVKKKSNSNVISSQARGFFGFADNLVNETIKETFDFVSGGINLITAYDNSTNNILPNGLNINNSGQNQNNFDIINSTANRLLTV